MAGTREKPEDIVLPLRQVEVLMGQGRSTAEAVRQIAVTVQSYYGWRKEYGGMSRDQLKRLKESECENAWLRRSVSDLTLDQLVLTVSAEDEGDQETILWMVFIPDAPAHLSPSCRPAALFSRISNALPRQRASDCEALERLGVSHDYRNVEQQRSAFEP